MDGHKKIIYLEGGNNENELLRNNYESDGGGDGSGDGGDNGGDGSGEYNGGGGGEGGGEDVDGEDVDGVGDGEGVSEGSGEGVSEGSGVGDGGREGSGDGGGRTNGYNNYDEYNGGGGKGSGRKKEHSIDEMSENSDTTSDMSSVRTDDIFAVDPLYLRLTKFLETSGTNNTDKVNIADVLLEVSNTLKDLTTTFKEVAEVFKKTAINNA
jgi:hypothetical protein